MRYSLCVRRAFRYRVYPTPEQAAELNRTFGCVRKVWNLSLAERHRRWASEQQSSTYAQTSGWLTAWKRDPELAFLREVSSVPLQQGLRHQQAAFSNFFAGRARYPRYKARQGRQSAEYTTSAFRWRDGRLTLAKMSEPLDIRWSRPLPDGTEPSTVTISRDPSGRWHVSILVDDPTVQPLPSTAETVGVDLGLKSFAVTSDGETVDHPRLLERKLRRLARYQRIAARKKPGSANRAKANRKVARTYAKVTDARRDFLHKTSTNLIRRYGTVAIEDLNVAGMARNRHIARWISDSAWGEFRAMLAYKAYWYGRQLVVIDRWYPSSKTCSMCGYLLHSLNHGTRHWTCPGCGTRHNRDLNAAKNIRAAGLAALACGGDVRPSRATGRQTPVKQESRPVRAESPRR